MPTLREELEEKVLGRTQSAEQSGAGVKADTEIPGKAAQSVIEPKPVAQPKPTAVQPKVEETQRDEQGRFAPKEKEGEQARAAPSATPPSATPAEPAKPPIGTTQPPPTWSAEAKALWGQIPEGVRAEVMKREKDALKGIGQYKRGHEQYERFMQLAHPYMPLISAEGATLEAAFKNYLDTAATLRLGTLEQKHALILNLARQFGVPLAQPQGAPAPEGASQQHAEDPRVAALQARIEQMEAERNRQIYAERQRQYEAEQQTSTAIDADIEAFVEDPAHPHFGAVREDMAAFIGAGRAKTLQEAYDMAVFANPSTRSLVLAEQQAEAERKRKEEEARRLEAAKNAAGSVKSSPAAGTSDSPKGSLREELVAQFRAAGARI